MWMPVFNSNTHRLKVGSDIKAVLRLSPYQICVIDEFV
ncbi:hypothetical protein ymoll0001_13180 [Yersinia mollaretii ATCC 43969]|uniref:Uncharacterized protein n=1 Tax=Yersinia mollaretii (strain ATCC 43969 / DSM 18520 / CIP 103324 / CNY 7263 / WAIP 204) TaxID=349967 RepID=A0ABM9Y6U4_YERMW|nr:hypothetical protein ymoll0001_13180 [Yersinia mollaretii ATCC 43969]